MSTYENAPATKLLATACACCGRALVDAVSVETGIGPDCRAKFAVDVVADESARAAANLLVHAVAKRGVDRKECRAICAQLEALGFSVLAARILKRFRMTTSAPERTMIVNAPLALVPAAPASAPSVDVAALRAEYRRTRADFAYDNASEAEINAACVASGAKSPADFVAALERVTCPCKRCAGTGAFITRVENGEPRGPGGECFRCGGKGHQNLADARRNRAFDAYSMSRAS